MSDCDDMIEVDDYDPNELVIFVLKFKYKNGN